ncbi:beta-eliminating lyase-related protein [Xanthobacter sp. V4C-4]|uniref:threonine aldolase family protein n=1 Tax=Xanthobacter cornucopiae TaxID=3119924 RepID=UPI00372C4F98
MDFASDNTGGLAPAIQAALARASAGHAAAYGGDEGSARLDAAFGVLFETEVRVFPVLSGTAANALALAHLLPPWGAVLCHADAHIQTDECGAPEFFSAGAKLLTLPGDHGRIDPAALAARLDAPASAHQVQPAVLSLSQATEAGTCYAAAALAACAGAARARGLKVHMDGARFANAVAGLGHSPAALTWRAGVDVLSFGTSKNGGMMAEAVVFFDPALAAGFDRRRKRAGQLMAKGRFLAAQLLASIEDGLWLRLAGHANGLARRLGAGLAALGYVPVHPVEANSVFVRLPEPLAQALRHRGARFYDWPTLGPQGRRFVTSFATGGEEVDRLIELARVG